MLRDGSLIDRLAPVWITHELAVNEAYAQFFADGLGMRAPVAGTVARGWLREDVAFNTGLTERGDTLRTMPIPQRCITPPRRAPRR